LIRGGHAQTLATSLVRGSHPLAATKIPVNVSEGDQIVLHRDQPGFWRPGDGSILLIHGISGCHAAPYMIRLARRFLSAGIRTYRMDLRGVGDAASRCQNVSHAGRSDDVLAGLAAIAREPGSGPLAAVGVSLGGAQLLRAVGMIGGDRMSRPAWYHRLNRIAAVCPPLNLHRCSANMQRLSRRPYNWYFIRNLLARVPEGVRRREEFIRGTAGRGPRTLFELDDRITAPLSGFRDAAHYYDIASSHHQVDAIDVETLIVAAEDDPIVPADCFTDPAIRFSPMTHVIISPGGGHVGFVDHRRRCWLDDVLARWFASPDASSAAAARPQPSA